MIIPESAIQQHIAVLGKTGSGKTFAVKGIVEHLLNTGRRVGIVDPTGAWWGLRSSKDGKGPGFPILVLGGDHGDLPLPALGGAAVARLLCDQAVNLIADTSQLTVGERTRWFIDFANTLHRTNKGPLHLVLDEAHNFAPQGKVMDPDAGKMLHATNRLASEGRSRGIRLAMITQRPQKLHKDTLTSADTLIAMRVLAPHDRTAVEDWIKGCGDIQQGKDVLNSLASMQRGEGWVWYPEGGFLERMKFPAIKTFDSSATPTDGHQIQAPKGAAEIDLAEIKTALADAVKEVEANDPKLLRAQITGLNSELAKLRKAPVSANSAAPDLQLLKNYRDEGYRDGVLAGRAEALTGVVKVLADTREHLTWALSNVDAVTHETGMAQLKAIPPREGATNYSKNIPAPVKHKVQIAAKRSGDQSDSKLPPGERAILIACAQHEEGCTREQLTVLTGYKRSSRDTYIQRLREKGFVDTAHDRIVAPREGIAALGSDYEPLPAGQALRDYWFNRLPEGERKILGVLCDRFPNDVSRDDISAETDYKRSSRDTYIQRLRSRELLITSGGQVRASETLFD